MFPNIEVLGGRKKEKLFCCCQTRILKKTTIEDMWLRELNDLEKALAKYKNDRKVRQFGLGAKIKKGKKKGKKGKK